MGSNPPLVFTLNTYSRKINPLKKECETAGAIAQWTSHCDYDPGVGGSNPTLVFILKLQFKDQKKNIKAHGNLTQVRHWSDGRVDKAM